MVASGSDGAGGFGPTSVAFSARLSFLRSWRSASGSRILALSVSNATRPLGAISVSQENTLVRNLHIKVHPFVQHPSNLHTTSALAINHVVMLHPVKTTTLEEVASIFATDQHGIFRDGFESTTQFPTIDMELLNAPGIQGIFKDSLQVGIRLAR